MEINILPEALMGIGAVLMLGGVINGLWNNITEAYRHYVLCVRAPSLRLQRSEARWTWGLISVGLICVVAGGFLLYA